MFDGLDHVFEYGAIVLLTVDAHKVAGVLSVNQLFEGSVVEKLLLDLRMLVVVPVNQSRKNLVIMYVFLQHVVEPVGLRVEPSLFKLVVDQMVTHLKSHEQAWLLIELLQHRDLVIGRWSPL